MDVRVDVLAFVALLVACGGPPAEEPRPTPRHTALPDESNEPAISPTDTCGDTGRDFGAWLQSFSHYAVTQGVSPVVVAGALESVVYDPQVIELDRTQRPHRATFEAFAASHITFSRRTSARTKAR